MWLTAVFPLLIILWLSLYSLTLWSINFFACSRLICYLRINCKLFKMWLAACVSSVFILNKSSRVFLNDLIVLKILSGILNVTLILIFWSQFADFCLELQLKFLLSRNFGLSLRIVLLTFNLFDVLNIDNFSLGLYRAHWDITFSVYESCLPSFMIKPLSCHVQLIVVNIFSKFFIHLQSSWLLSSF